MRIGCVKEIKKLESRVGLTPSSVKEYVNHKHEVYIEKEAGLNSGFTDQDYLDQGATILESAANVWEKAEMIVKVKEPLESEYQYFRPGLIIYTYLHLAADDKLTMSLLKNKVKGVAYETIVLPDGSLPCLKPMSEVAGRLSVIEGAKHLEKPFGGSGVLISGVPGVARANVAIIGAGVVGENALKMAVGLNANVTVLDVNMKKLTYLDDIYGSKTTTLYSNNHNVEDACINADLVISGVLLPGAVPRTSTIALNNSTLRYGLMIADMGLEEAIKESEPLKFGVNTYEGKCTCRGVADAFNLECQEL